MCKTSTTCVQETQRRLHVCSVTSSYFCECTDLFLLQIYNFPFKLVKLHSNNKEPLHLRNKSGAGPELQLLFTVNSSVTAEPTRFEFIYLRAKLKNCSFLFLLLSKRKRCLTFCVGLSARESK